MTRWKLSIVLAALVCLAAAAAAPAEAKEGTRGPRPDRYILPGNAVFPEGVAFQPRTGYFYVSSTTDGTIFRGHVRQEMTEVFLPGGQDGRTTAIGLKVDKAGRLFVAGGDTGQVFVYDSQSKALLARFDNDLAATFVNDVAIAKDGSAYFTDSLNPYLYKVSQNAAGEWQYERWIDFTGTALAFQAGFNVNGSVATPDGKYLIVVQSNTGKLYRIAIDTKEVVPIDLGGESVPAGDGLLLLGRRLYVVQNQLGQIAKVRLSGNLSRGEVVSRTSDPSFRFPTTIARARGRLLVVNSQFNRRGPGLTPELPFTVSSIRIP